jgi:hypothetical protein
MKRDWMVSQPLFAASALEPAVVACLDDQTLRDATIGASFWDQVVLAAEMLSRGLPPTAHVT